MAPALPKPARKRVRKRKRRAASSSSDDSSDDSDSSSSPQTKVTAPTQPTRSAATQPSSSEESSSSDSDSSSEDEKAVAEPQAMAVDEDITPATRHRSPTPPPVPATIPSFLPEEPSPENEALLKEKFRKFWMASVADAFKDDLVEIRKEPNFTTSRLSMLIESLASGAEVFKSTANDHDVNEMEVVVENQS